MNESKKELGKCASCKSWFSRVREDALMVAYGDTDIYVEVCGYCAEDYYPEAKKLFANVLDNVREML